MECIQELYVLMSMPFPDKFLTNWTSVLISLSFVSEQDSKIPQAPHALVQRHTSCGYTYMM